MGDARVLAVSRRVLLRRVVALVFVLAGLLAVALSLSGQGDGAARAAGVPTVAAPAPPSDGIGGAPSALAAFGAHAADQPPLPPPVRESGLVPVTGFAPGFSGGAIALLGDIARPLGLQPGVPGAGEPVVRTAADEPAFAPD